MREYKGQTGSVLAVSPLREKIFATSSTDGTIRFWNRDRDEPLLSLFFGGTRFAAANEWVAWTPEGYSPLSPGGERYGLADQQRSR